MVFHHPLPSGTEVRDMRGVSFWVIPKMTRHTRFPMMASKHIVAAYDFIEKVRAEGDIPKYLLVAWCWDDSHPGIKVRLRFFRNLSSEVLGLGAPHKPDWFIEMEEGTKEAMPSAWDRLMGDDNL